MSGPSERDDQHGEQKGEHGEVIDNLRALFSPSASSQGHVSLLQQAAGQRSVGSAPRHPPTTRPSPAAAAASALALDPLGDEQDDDLRPVATIEKFGPKIYARAMTMGGFTPWVNSQDFKATRNKREVEVLAQALDQLLLEGVSMEMSLGMEILARRLTAVHLADHSKNWKIAEAIQLPTVASSLLPQAELNAVIRTAATMTRLDASLHPRRSTTRYHRGGGGYGGGGGDGWWWGWLWWWWWWLSPLQPWQGRSRKLWSWCPTTSTRRCTRWLIGRSWRGQQLTPFRGSGVPVFPLPAFSIRSTHSHSRRVQQRHARGLSATLLANRCISALNRLNVSFSSLPSSPSLLPSRTRHRLLDRIFDLSSRLLSRQAQGAPSDHDLSMDNEFMYVSGNFTPTVPLRADLVSLPSAAATVSLLDILPPHLASLYSNPQQLLLSSPRSGRTPPLRMGVDASEYTQLIRRMLPLGMLSFTTDPKVVNGIFATPKPDGLQRLIINGRRGNRVFIDPPSCLSSYP